MLDLLEAGLAGLRPNGAPAVPQAANSPAAAVSPDHLREEMEQGGFSTHEIASGLGLPRAAVDDWLEGRIPVPPLALASVQILRRLTLSERRKLPNGTAPKVANKAPDAPARIHPFSRIEEL
jgi:hypothetical protein